MVVSNKPRMQCLGVLVHVSVSGILGALVAWLKGDIG